MMKKTNLIVMVLLSLLFLSLQSCKKDETDPTITLKGDNPMFLNLGESYVELGATANDDKDGDLTSDISISGAVNSNKSDEYSISYQVKDKSGNSTTIIRSVCVKANKLAGTYEANGPNGTFEVTVQSSSTFNRLVIRKFNNFPNTVLFYAMGKGNTISFDYKLFSDSQYQYQIKNGLGYYSAKGNSVFTIDSVNYIMDKRPLNNLTVPNESSIHENWTFLHI